jgi:hypothetical protein
MAQRSKPQVAAPPAFSQSEHIYIGSDDLGADPAAAARTPRAACVLDNPVRHDGFEITLYAEGVAKVAERRKGEVGKPVFLDLRFIDPVPKIERVAATRSLYTALGSVGVGALAAFLLRFDALHVGAAAVLGAAVLAASAAIYSVIYRSQEATEFCTLHGRVPVLKLVANLGAIKRFRAFVPTLSGAIEEAAELIGDDTAAYLRAEMREHYRLRGDGVLDTGECAAGTGRILAQFDLKL